MRRILLVDGTNIVMRYAHAMMPHGSVDTPEESDITRERSAAVFGAVERAIRECAQIAGAPYAVVAIDRSPSWRYDVYPEYKAARAGGGTSWWSEGLVTRLAANGIQCASAPGFEADDVVATLADRTVSSGRHAAVLSGDSDLLVLASEACDVYQFGRKDEPRFVKRSPEWIAAKYQIASAALLRDFKAIVGEAGDSLPGIDGYGPVKARQLLKRFGTAEALLESVALRESDRARLALMLTLVSLRTDAPIEAIAPAMCRLEAA